MPKGVIQIFAPFQFSVGTYCHIAFELSRAGYEVVGYDTKGFGLSEGERNEFFYEDNMTDGLLFLAKTKQFLDKCYE